MRGMTRLDPKHRPFGLVGVHTNDYSILKGSPTFGDEETAYRWVEAQAASLAGEVADWEKFK